MRQLNYPNLPLYYVVVRTRTRRKISGGLQNRKEKIGKYLPQIPRQNLEEETDMRSTQFGRGIMYHVHEKGSFTYFQLAASFIIPMEEQLLP